MRQSVTIYIVKAVQSVLFFNASAEYTQVSTPKAEWFSNGIQGGHYSKDIGIIID